MGCILPILIMVAMTPKQDIRIMMVLLTLTVRPERVLHLL
jgi:hypothetical protein